MGRAQVPPGLTLIDNICGRVARWVRVGPNRGRGNGAGRMATGDDAFGLWETQAGPTLEGLMAVLTIALRANLRRCRWFGQGK